MQEAYRLSDEADHLISEAKQLLGKATDRTKQAKDDLNMEGPNDEQSKTEMISERGFWFKLAAIDMNEESIDEDVIPTRAECQ